MTDPNKQENNIRYQTYSRKGYNRNGSIKETITDLILDTEEKNIDTTETKDKIIQGPDNCATIKQRSSEQ